MNNNNVRNINIMYNWRLLKMKLNTSKRVYVYKIGNSILFDLFNICFEFKNGKFIDSFKLPF